MVTRGQVYPVENIKRKRGSIGRGFVKGEAGDGGRGRRSGWREDVVIGGRVRMVMVVEVMVEANEKKEVREK